MCLFFELRSHSLSSWLLCWPLAYLTLGSLPCFFLLLEQLFRLAAGKTVDTGDLPLIWFYLFGCIPGVGLVVLWVMTGPHDEDGMFGFRNGHMQKVSMLSADYSAWVATVEKTVCITRMRIQTIVQKVHRQLVLTLKKGNNGTLPTTSASRRCYLHA